MTRPLRLGAGVAWGPLAPERRAARQPGPASAVGRVLFPERPRGPESAPARLRPAPCRLRRHLPLGLAPRLRVVQAAPEAPRPRAPPPRRRRRGWRPWGKVGLVGWTQSGGLARQGIPARVQPPSMRPVSRERVPTVKAREMVTQPRRFVVVGSERPEARPRRGEP